MKPSRYTKNSVCKAEIKGERWRMKVLENAFAQGFAKFADDWEQGYL